MNKLRAFWTRLLNTLRRATYSDDFAEELETHVAMDTERGIRNGLSPDEARRQALIHFGGIAQAHEAYAERQGVLNPCCTMLTTACGLSYGTVS